jgi:hypothetical protein
MTRNIGKEVAAMQRMTVAELRGKYAEVFGEETRSRHKKHLLRRIAWRLQANEEGDLSERARHRARELAADPDVRMTPPPPKAETACGVLPRALPALRPTRLTLPQARPRRRRARMHTRSKRRHNEPVTAPPEGGSIRTNCG